MAGTHSHVHRGFHPQGTTGAFSAAGTAARLLRLSPEQTLHALAIGASQAAGLMAAQEGAMTKRFHSGRAAQSGVYGALLAERGFTGIENAIEAPFGGFLSSYADEADPGALTAGLGATWETLAIGFKPNPTVSCVQAPIKALGALMGENGLAAADIERVEVGCSTFTHKHSVWPYAGASVTEAQMNMAYALAVTAIDGAAFVEQYREDRIADRAILEFTKRVEAAVDPEIDAMGAEFRDAVRLTVHTADGRALERDLLYRPGSPEDPMTPAEIADKFVKLCAESPLAARAEEIAAAVDALEGLDDAAGLAKLLGTGSCLRSE
jgi:2-methylcitrate dehydratase PrpD